MDNKKIATWLGIVVIIIFAITVSFFVWQYEKINGRNIAQTKPIVSAPVAQKPTQPVSQQSSVSSTVATQPTTENADYNSVEYQGNKINLNLPQGWGKLVVPQVDEDGVILDSVYGSKDNQAFINTPYLITEFTKIISNYNFGNRTDYSEAPSVSLATYPAMFTDDIDQGQMEVLTAQEKEDAFKPLLDVFAKKGLSKVDLSQKCFLTGDCSKLLYGYWWDNVNGLKDRVAVRYFENSDSNLRGIGYFSFSGQDEPDDIDGYNIVLINPQKRIVVYLYFPLEGIYKFPVLSNDGTIDFKKAYGYLENPTNYKNTQLEQFMKEVQSLVSSIKVAS